jgi:transcriptional regulator with XRE-family HTH domain
LSQQDFALRLGTSRPRLSTYLSGKVTPSASLMVRMRRVATQAQASDDQRAEGVPVP